MTREEALRLFRKEIECLSHTKCEDCILKKDCDPMITTPSDSEYIEAYSMAIKALEQEPILDKIRAEIGKSKTENEMQIAERDIKAKLLISHIYCDIVNILDKYKEESEGKWNN